MYKFIQFDFKIQKISPLRLNNLIKKKLVLMLSFVYRVCESLGKLFLYRNCINLYFLMRARFQTHAGCVHSARSFRYNHYNH